MIAPWQKQIVQKLIDSKITITAAESLTAGLFQSTLGDVAGISAIFPGGFITYANESKHQLVGVKQDTIQQFGVVSKQTAIEMACGAKQRLNTQLALSFTGAAGPKALEGNPPGTVWIGLAFKNDVPFARCYHLQGTRDTIRTKAVVTGFQLLAQLF